MSEHDWQAVVLAELGIPRSGLVTPDSTGAFPPTERHQAPSSEALARHAAQAVEPATRIDEEWSDRPLPTQWDEPAAENRRSTGERHVPAARPFDGPPAAADALASPDVPAAAPEERPAGWSAPAWEPPVDAPRTDGGGGAGRPEETRYEEAVPNQAAAWELASQASWGLVAQEPWGTEPPHDGAPPAAGWERSDAEARPSSPGAPQPPLPHRPSAQDLVRRSTHGDPLVRRVGRGVRRAMGAAAAHEIRKSTDLEGVLGRPVASCRQIAVTSIRGGAGKTTVAALAAGVIAQYRQDRVLAVDADAGLGSLPLRLGIRTERSLHDLHGFGARSFEEAAPFLGRTADGLWVLSGTTGGQIAHELDLATYKATAGRLSRYFSAMVIDCGAGVLPELQRGILADAHAQVLVTSGTVDGALSAQGALEWQARNGYQHLLARTIIALVTHTPHVDADLTRGAQLLSGGGMPVVHMPYDRHLATGAAADPARIGQETRAAAIRVATEAFARAASA